jgi:hypothetical protein
MIPRHYTLPRRFSAGFFRFRPVSRASEADDFRGVPDLATYNHQNLWSDADLHDQLREDRV